MTKDFELKEHRCFSGISGRMFVNFYFSQGVLKIFLLVKVYRIYGEIKMGFCLTKL